MVIDAFKEVGGLASTDVTPEGFLYDVLFPPPSPSRKGVEIDDFIGWRTCNFFALQVF